MDRMRKTYFDNQSPRNILPLNDEHTEKLDLNSGRPDPTLIQTLFRHLRGELDQEFIRYCEERISEFEIDSIDEFLTKSIDELTLLFNDINDGKRTGHAEEDGGTFVDPDVEALLSNSDGTGKATKKHYAELFQIISDAAIGRFNERFYYFYAYLTHWIDRKKSQYLDQDLLFCIDVSRLREIANESLLQTKIRFIFETYVEASATSNNFTCRLDLTNADLQTRIGRSLQRSLATNINDFSPLDEARTFLVKEKLVYFYAGFKAYLFRMNLLKTHPSRLARLQEQVNIYKQQQHANKSAKTTTRSSASTANKSSSPRKVVTVMSKHRSSVSTTSVDITTITKTQRILNERMKAFENIRAQKVIDVSFPNAHKFPQQQTLANNKLRTANILDGHVVHPERGGSVKEKSRGPLFVQYSLTSGLKVKHSDGKPFEEQTNGTGFAPQQAHGSMAYSLGSTND